MQSSQKPKIEDPRLWISTPALFAHYCSGKRWYPAKHLVMLSDVLMDVAEGKIKHLMISMPPRSGKSELTSKYFPAWFLGHYPDKRVILSSYESDFAAQWGYKARNILSEHGHLFGLKVAGDSSAKDRWDIAGHLGGMNTAGVGSAITGKGAHLLLIDDPVKNAEEANSKTYRDKAFEWFRSTAYTRLEPGGSVVLIMTRWHSADLAGMLLQDEPDKWTVINLPAIAEENDAMGRKPGEALFPKRYDVPALMEIKRTLGSYWWNALYQQRPSAIEGAVFKRPHFKYCSIEYKQVSRNIDGRPYITEFPSFSGISDTSIFDLGDRKIAYKDCIIFQTCDPAASTKTTADYFVLATWAQTKQNDLILLDVLRTRLEGPDQINLFKEQFKRWNPAYQAVEAVGIGKTLYQMLVREGLPIRELKADTDKISRALPAAARMEAGTIYFMSNAAWLGDFEDELLSFPTGSHDDQCFVAGTMITTDAGLIPIEQLDTRYKVLTRNGYKEILSCGKTSDCSDVKTLVFENGKTLTGTRHHPIYVIGKGFIPLDTISYGDCLLSELPVLKKSSSMEPFLEDIQIPPIKTTGDIIPRTVLTDITVLGHFIRKYGKHAMVRYPLVMLSTMPTAILSTTLQKTLYVCWWDYIHECISWKAWTIQNTLKKCESTLKKSGQWRLLGIGQQRGANGILNMLRKCMQYAHLSRKNASSVEKCSGTWHDVTTPAFVQMHVLPSGGACLASMTKKEHASYVDKNSSLIDSQEHGAALEVVQVNCVEKKQAVFNLSVKDEHEYFANGVLVHNCDVLGYAVKLLLDQPQSMAGLASLFKTKPRRP